MKRGPNPINEIEFMRALLLAIGSMKGLRVWRQNSGKVVVRDRSGKAERTFDAGIPNGAADISGIVDVNGEGVRIEIETKAQGGKLSHTQKNWRAMIESLGGIYIVAAAVDTATVDENVAIAVGVVTKTINGRRARYAF